MRRAAVFEKVPDGAFPIAQTAEQHIPDSPALASDVTPLIDPASTPTALKEPTAPAHQQEPRTVLTVFGWLFVSITMITISIILTAVYL